MKLKKEFYEQYKKNNGWVYLVHAEGTLRFKIGRSINPYGRLSQLQGQSPYPLVLQECIWTPDAIYYEQCLHQEFNKCRVFGEWFEFVEPSDLVNAYNKFRWRSRTDIYEICHCISSSLAHRFYEVKPFCELERFTEINFIVQEALATSQCLDDLVLTIDFFLEYLLETWIKKKLNACHTFNINSVEYFEEFACFLEGLRQRTDCFIHGLHRGNIYEFF